METPTINALSNTARTIEATRGRMNYWAYLSETAEDWTDRSRGRRGYSLEQRNLLILIQEQNRGHK